MRKIIDLKNNEYGYLKVLDLVGKDKFGSINWKCLCKNCGNKVIVTSRELRRKYSGKTHCGCIKHTGKIFEAIYTNRDKFGNYETVRFEDDNQTKFAQKHNLCPQSISACLSGKQETHKNFRFRYIENKNA